jgi:hypothetical protein
MEGVLRKLTFQHVPLDTVGVAEFDVADFALGRDVDVLAVTISLFRTDDNVIQLFDWIPMLRAKQTVLLPV